MRKIRIVAMILALCVALGAVSVSATFADTKDTVYEAAVRDLRDVGVIQGHPDGSFRPDDALTLAEMATLAARAFRLGDTGKHTLPGVSGHWSYGYLMACLDNGGDAAFGNVTAADLGKPVQTETFAALVNHLLGSKYGIENISISGTGTLPRGKAAAILHNLLTTPFEGTDTTIIGLIKADNIMKNSKMLRYFTLASYYEDDMINAVKIGPDPAAFVYDSRYDGFVATDATLDNIIYNFVAIYSTAGDATGDKIFIVNREDGEKYWDSEATYVSKDDPKAFTNEYNIPFGGRLLGHEAIFDGAVTDFLNLTTAGDLSKTPYYRTYDWYNSTSAETLTMLPHFRTSQQTTGWACGLTCAIMAMDWFDLRGGLNELDLAALRNTKEKYGTYRWGSATDVKMFINVFSEINKMEGREVWKWDSTYDYVDADGKLSEKYLSPEFIVSSLAKGIPILVGWNSFGGHWQVIIGYDDMGTELTADDVLLLADPYDTTDHLNDGVTVQPYERMYWDWSQNFDRDFSRDKEYGMPVVFMPYPADYDSSAYKTERGSGLSYKKDAIEIASDTTEDMLIPYGKTVADLAASEYKYAKSEAGENGMSGPASSDYYRQFQQIGSPYYPQPAFYGGAKGISESLILLDGFKTSQQASEWTCGPAALRMVLNWFGLMGDETEFGLAHKRGNDKEGATTLDGITQMVDALDIGLAYLTTDDLDDDDCIGDYCLSDGAKQGGLIPYCLKNGIPILIGWNEWGGHWQVIIGYDDMGTEGTQDDVLILADPYDTTDHLQDGYMIESFERLVYGWGASFDERGYNVFAIVSPSATLSEAFDIA